MTARISAMDWSLRCSPDGTVEANAVAGMVAATRTGAAKMNTEIFRNIDIFFNAAPFQLSSLQRRSFFGSGLDF
jgi:hypothetical protein